MALGSKDTIARLRVNPLTRALRPDKLNLAALEVTLRLYLDEFQAVAGLPTLSMLTRPLAEVERQARSLARSLKRRWGARLKVEVQPSLAQAGGGSLPLAPLQSFALALEMPPLAPQQLEIRLRQARPPIIARVERQMVLLDMRTILPEDREDLLTALKGVIEGSAVLPA
jgi:L-seryl-tRNA(Ser) seleniumtransferase